MGSLGNGLQGLAEAGSHSRSMICQDFVCDCPHMGIFARLNRERWGHPGRPGVLLGHRGCRLLWQSCLLGLPISLITE